MLSEICLLSYGKFMCCFEFFFAWRQNKNIPKATTARKKKTPLCILAQCLACLQCFAVQSLSHVQLIATPRMAGHQGFLSITISQSLLKLMSIELVIPSNHLILCRPLLLLPSFFPNIRVFSNELSLHIMWPKYWSFGFSSSPSNEY